MALPYKEFKYRLGTITQNYNTYNLFAVYFHHVCHRIDNIHYVYALRVINLYTIV